VEFWRGAAAQARDVLRDADLERVMDTPLGQTAADDLSVPVIDLYVHAWDAGTVAGIAVEIPSGVIGYAHAYIDPLLPGVARGEGRAFGPQTRLPADATPAERFIAWTGREYRADRRPSRTRQAALHPAGRLGRRNGKAAAYWQIGDRSGADAQPFYRGLLRGIGQADQQITGLCGVPT
jgi:hypothetical protein